MGITKLKAKAEIPSREWVEFEVELSPEGRVTEVRWRAWGCHTLIGTAEEAAHRIKTQMLEGFSWPGHSHSDLLITEIMDRLKAGFNPPYKGEEVCHCRKIQAEKIDEAIVLGAHTPEKVTAWTTASSGCGTCRPDVEKMIAFRLRKS